MGHGQGGQRTRSKQSDPSRRTEPNPASCTEYGLAPPLSLLLAQAMTAQHGSKYGLGERVGVMLSESPSAASRPPLKGDAEDGDGASKAHTCPAMVRHGQWFRRGILRSVEMLRHGRQRQACPGEASGLSVKIDVRRATQNSMRNPTPVRGQMACVSEEDVGRAGH